MARPRALATGAWVRSGYNQRGHGHAIDYQLVRTPGGWRVFDVQSANGGSLRERIMSGEE